MRGVLVDNIVIFYVAEIFLNSNSSMILSSLWRLWCLFFSSQYLSCLLIICTNFVYLALYLSFGLFKSVRIKRSSSLMISFLTAGCFYQIESCGTIDSIDRLIIASFVISWRSINLCQSFLPMLVLFVLEKLWTIFIIDYSFVHTRWHVERLFTLVIFCEVFRLVVKQGF